MQHRIIELTSRVSTYRSKPQLYLSYMNITDQEIEHQIIPFLKNHPEISELDVSNNKITDQGAELIAKMNLGYVNVRDNNIGAEGAKAFAANQSIRSLTISCNRIGDIGAKALAANPNFTTLYANNICDYGDEGRKALAETNPVKRANHGIDVGMNIEVPSLKRLCLFACKNLQLDQSQLPQELQESLAKAKI